MACLDGRLPGHEAHANGAEEYSRAMPAVTLIAADCAGHGGRMRVRPCYGRWCEVVRMRRLRPSSETEMVALFLRTELAAARFRDKLQALLESYGLPERVITDPDLGDAAENQAGCGC